MNLVDGSSLSVVDAPHSPPALSCPTSSPLSFNIYDDYLIRHFALYSGLLGQHEVLRLYKQPLIKERSA